MILLVSLFACLTKTSAAEGDQPTGLMNTKTLMFHTATGHAPHDANNPILSSFPVMAQALSLSGPLGPSGALGDMGPIGDNAWNPSAWWTKMEAAGAWKMAPGSAKEEGPLSKEGPLGDKGPLKLAVQEDKSFSI